MSNPWIISSSDVTEPASANYIIGFGSNNEIGGLTLADLEQLHDALGRVLRGIEASEPEKARIT